MDLQTALVSVGVCVLSAVVVYLISVFGMREKTYEEAIEEQRKRNQEAAQHSKVEKPKKEKKFKKQGKRLNKESSLNSEEETEQAAGANHVNDHVDFKTETEFIPLELDLDSKPPKAKKKFKAPKSILTNKQDVSPVIPEAPLLSQDDDDGNDSPPAFVPKDEVERRQSMDIGTKKLASLMQSNQLSASLKEMKEDVATGVPAELKAPQLEVKVQVQEVKAQPEVKVDKKNEEMSSKKSKKPRSESFENADGGELSFKKLLGAIKKVTMVDDEIQTLIDTLLNKQQGGSEWTKKNDPVAALKKQLAEREAAVETEQRAAQAANTKVRDVRQELSQEKSRASASERALRQELQAMHGRMQGAIDQQAKGQQTQLKVSEEKNALQQQVQLLEVERQKWLVHEREMQRELEDRYQATLSQEQERMSLQVQSNEVQLQQMLASQQEADFQRSQAMAELKQNLQEANARCAATSQELEVERSSVRQRLDEKDLLLRKQDEDVQRLKRMAEEERLKLQSHSDLLQGQVKNATNQLQDYRGQVALLQEGQDSLHQKVAQLSEERDSLRQDLAGAHRHSLEVQEDSQAVAHLQQEGALLNNRLGETEAALKQKQSELSMAHNELETQKAKNNELREKNWKAIDAYSALEKSSKEREASLSSEVGQARQAHQEALAQCQQQEQRNEQSQTLAQGFISGDQVQRLQEEDRSCLQRLLPDVHVDKSLEHSSWMEKFSNQVQEKLTSATVLRTENSSLAAQVNHYQTVLSDTEGMLKKLQSGVEAQDAMWTQKLAAQEALTHKVEEEKRVLEEQLQQLQGIEEATAEMQGRLKELQAKLQGEESDKKHIETKAEEALQRCSALTSDLEAKDQELERLRTGQETLDRVTGELDQLKKDLEKERKITKELGSQVVKLNSLVKIGQDALRAEQELVKQLQVVSTASNGNKNNNNINNNTIPAANGTAVENEGASGKK